MSKARELAELGAAYDSGALSNRNLVINGAMTVSQRGTSEASVTSSQYADAPDRFKVEMNTAGTWTVSQSTTAPEGFANSYKFDCTTADGSLGAGDYIHLSHYFEGQNLQHLQKGSSAAQKVTLSFHVRSAKTGTYIVEFFDQDNSRSISKSYTIDAANTWEKKTITIDGDTSGAFGNDNGASFGVFFFLAAGSNFSSGTLNTSWGSRTIANIAVGQVNLADSTSNDWYLTGVQLEVGTEATPFEHRSFGDELHRCQRYFEVIVSGNSKEIGGGNYYSSSSIHCPTIFETSKRTESYSVTVTGGTNYFLVYRDGTSDSFDGFTGSTRANINRCLLYATSNVSGTAGHGLELLTNNASAKVVIDDEL
jgi:hypothetical protein